MDNETIEYDNKKGKDSGTNSDFVTKESKEDTLGHSINIFRGIEGDTFADEETKYETLIDDDEHEALQSAESNTAEATGESSGEMVDGPGKHIRRLRSLFPCCGRSKLNEKDVEPYGTNSKSVNCRGIGGDAETQNYKSGDKKGNANNDRAQVSPRDKRLAELQEQSMDGTQLENETSNLSVNTEGTLQIDKYKYDFSHPHRGYMVVVVNDSFRVRKPRIGADKDLKNIKDIAQKFGFTICNRDEGKNLTKKKLEDLIDSVSSMDHSERDCFAFMISTHGLEQKNARKGGRLDHALVCTDEQLILTSDITEKFDNCSTLKGKPKFFFIQACRGRGLDKGVSVQFAVTKRTEAESMLRTRTSSRDERDVKGSGDSWIPDTPSIECAKDQLVMFAVPPGMYAWRSEIDGSWMIHYLHSVLMAYDLEQPRDFLKVLTEVNRQMSLRTTDVPSNSSLTDKKAVSVIEHKLTRGVVFQRKF